MFFEDLPSIEQERNNKDEQEEKMARPEGFEPPTAWFVARYSIQLSYGRVMYSLQQNPNTYRTSLLRTQAL